MFTKVVGTTVVWFKILWILVIYLYKFRQNELTMYSTLVVKLLVDQDA